MEYEGCNVHGHVLVNKGISLRSYSLVAGNFHFAPGKSFQRSNLHFHDLEQYVKHKLFHFSHVIHDLSFGSPVGFSNPLDSAQKVAPHGML
jgi:hypothetical protein